MAGDILAFYNLGPYLTSALYCNSSLPTAWYVGLNAYNGPLQVFKKSFTTEFVAFDGACGVQGTQTAISGTYGNFDMPFASNGAGGAATNKMNDVAAFTSGDLRSGFERTLTIDSNKFFSANTAMGKRNNQFEARDQGPGGFMRPFSAGSSLNYGAYFAPTLVKHTIFNGSFFDFTSVTLTPQGMLGF